MARRILSPEPDDVVVDKALRTLAGGVPISYKVILSPLSELSYGIIAYRETDCRKSVNIDTEARFAHLGMIDYPR